MLKCENCCHCKLSIKTLNRIPLKNGRRNESKLTGLTLKVCVCVSFVTVIQVYVIQWFNSNTDIIALHSDTVRYLQCFQEGVFAVAGRWFNWSSWVFPNSLPITNHDNSKLVSYDHTNFFSYQITESTAQFRHPSHTSAMFPPMPQPFTLLTSLFWFGLIMM